MRPPSALAAVQPKGASWCCRFVISHQESSAPQPGRPRQWPAAARAAVWSGWHVSPGTAAHARCCPLLSPAILSFRLARSAGLHTRARSPLPSMQTLHRQRLHRTRCVEIANRNPHSDTQNPRTSTKTLFLLRLLGGAVDGSKTAHGAGCAWHAQAHP
jgi:hypothetical protein